MRFWPQSLFGLDIQAEEIRLLQLQGTRRKKRIKHALSRNLPLGAVIDGKIQEPEIVSDCLQELVRHNKLQAFGVAIALPIQCVVSQRISVAKGLHEAELEAEVVSHLSHCMPGVAAGLCYDHVIVGSQDDMQDDVFLVATSFENLNTPLAVVQNAGLKVQVVDVDKYALDRAIKLIIEQDHFHIEEKWLVSFGLALRSYDR